MYLVSDYSPPLIFIKLASSVISHFSYIQNSGKVSILNCSQGLGLESAFVEVLAKGITAHKIAI